mmetsp:Transcript_16545/g.27509  ORF Transcript_16545/g.27509 Transcript_16545/m.27509 type:complete len:114 (-) Transcript_16545:2-343(-)
MHSMHGLTEFSTDSFSRSISGIICPLASAIVSRRAACELERVGAVLSSLSLSSKGSLLMIETFERIWRAAKSSANRRHGLVRGGVFDVIEMMTYKPYGDGHKIPQNSLCVVLV